MRSCTHATAHNIYGSLVNVSRRVDMEEEKEKKEELALANSPGEKQTQHTKTPTNGKKFCFATAIAKGKEI